jgi:hypothetical protein
MKGGEETMINKVTQVAAGDPVQIDPSKFPHFKEKTGIVRWFVCDPLVVAEIEHKFHAEKLAAENEVRKNSIL